MKEVITAILMIILSGCDGWCDVEQIQMLTITNHTDQTVDLNFSYRNDESAEIEEGELTLDGNESYRKEIYRSESGRVCGRSQRLPPEENNAYVRFDFDPEEVTFMICEKIDPEYKIGTNAYHVFDKSEACPDDSYEMVTPEFLSNVDE